MTPSKKHSKKDKRNKACRICLSSNGENRITFDADSEWCRLLEYCVGIRISAEIGPQVLCAECSTKLKEYSEFKTLALKSDSVWSNVLSTEVKVDPVKETIEIKDEDGNYSDNNIQHDEIDYVFEIPVDDIKTHKAEHANEFDIPIKDESKIKDSLNPKKHKTKIRREKLKKETNKRLEHKEDLKGLSERQFIKKFFHIKTLKHGRWKISYECMNCGEKHKRRCGLSLHVQKCYETEVLILKSNKYKEKTQKSPPEIFDCGLCVFQNSDEDTVLQHVNGQHCLSNNMNCTLCDYVGRDTADMISHRFKHMQPLKYRGKYRCPTCYKSSLNELCLQFHYRAIHLNKAGGWCSICNKTFTGYIYFRNHMRLHSEEKYICDICGAKFLFRNLIEAHIKEHMNIRNYICHTCGKSFKRNNALTGHIRAYHTDYKPVPCDHCNKLFKNAYSLKMHMKMVKKGNRYICEVCCKGYPTLSLLKKHTFWHTGERPYACETCGGKYKSKGNLKLHIRKHMGIYPYKCGSCEKQFMTSTQLKAHSSVHTGIRRVKCLVCEKTFHEKRQMLAHCQSKHESFVIKHDSQLGQSTTLTTTQVPQVLPGPITRYDD